MGFIVEITARSGRVMERHRFDKPAATVGRGFDNDIIVHDPYVDARHLKITNDLNGLAIENLTEDGHTAVGHRDATEPRLPIASGAEIVIGKTHLRVFSTSHKVAPVMKFERIDRFFTALTHPLAVTLLTLGYVLFEYGNSYLSTFRETTWAADALALVTPLLQAFGWAAFWALISRISLGEPRFLHHWVAVLMALTLSTLLGRVQEVIAFNFASLVLNEVLNYVSMSIVVIFLLIISMRFAFRQRTWVRHAFAYTATGALVAYSLLTTYSFERDFSPYPEFDSTLMPKAFLWSRNVTEQQFLTNAERLFTFPEEALGETTKAAVELQPPDDASRTDLSAAAEWPPNARD